ncbi:MAG TPA: response regulator [Candidatus Obscuribacterales bacterium]
MTRILLIEDDHDFAQVLQTALRKEPDFEIVKVIGSEKEARHFLDSTKMEGIDCVLLDLQLPCEAGDKSVNSLSGLLLLEVMRQEQRFFGTVIVLTNSKSPADGQRALAGGCDGYLCKRAKISDIPDMVSELKMAIRGDVIMVARQMRHVFMRDDISAKEARMMDLLLAGKGWVEIARVLGYKTPKAAANVGDRVFDKLFTAQDQERASREGIKKRHLALEIWRSRRERV